MVLLSLYVCTLVRSRALRPLLFVLDSPPTIQTRQGKACKNHKTGWRHRWALEGHLAYAWLDNLLPTCPLLLGFLSPRAWSGRASSHLLFYLEAPQSVMVLLSHRASPVFFSGPPGSSGSISDYHRAC